MHPTSAKSANLLTLLGYRARRTRSASAGRNEAGTIATALWVSRQQTNGE